MALVFLVTALAPVQAQSTLGAYKAYIPFEFVVGNERYPAGDYKLRLETVSNTNIAALMRITDPNGEQFYSSFVLRNGNRSKDDATTLHFDRYGMTQYTYVLRQLVAPGFGFAVRSPKTETWVNITENLREKPETVSIALTAYN